MTKFAYHLFLVSILFVSCSAGNSEQVVNDSVLISPEPEIPLPGNSVIGFLKWYRSNETRLNKITLTQGGYPDTTTYYRVNFTNTEKYLDELKKSGFLSDKYISDFRNYFKRADSYLKNNPENDGPPAWFDYDLIMHAQDWEDAWSNLDHAKLGTKNINPVAVEVSAQFSKNYALQYRLSRINNKWLIDSIANAPRR